MDNSNLASSLQELATTGKGASKAARLRRVLDDVEAALAAGVPHVTLLETLKSHGIDMTAGTFKVTLSRLRAQRSKHPAAPGPSPVASSAPTSATTASPETPRTPSHDPADLDKIFRSQPDMHALAKLGRQRIERLKKK